ncbi:MAG: hypothetical protein AVDCRST_MAG41-1999 [uncultured Corynebacteriales bacterium]|uniref:AMP-dependent synthetase/ligase domain-containing protein n=1 Tax=uncultured Mycobacteriales bacterium TaxID=581187 RepID=A0A6J4IDU2_9ACTN|nr:MAG: hypothetical protein AVDCRST_MAG41-1999 [uncultured Corynebacteriales bacterium]
MTGGTVVDTCALPAVVDAMAGNTTARLLFRRAGTPVEVTYDRCRAEAAALAALLREHGVRPGDRVAIHGSTSYGWVLADLACLLAGAVSVALYSSAPPARAAAAAREGGCRVVLTDRPDAVALFRSGGAAVLPLEPTGSVPAGYPAAEPRTGPFTVVSTSGTLSEPKLFTVHSAPLLATMDRFAELYGFGAGDRLLLYLPLSHLPQRMMLYGGLRLGLDLVLSDPAHLVADTAWAAPTLHVTVPRLLEHVRSLLRRSGSTDYRGVFGPALRALFVGSAPTDPGLMAELIAAGVPVYEVYGTTELGMIGLNVPGARRPGTVGRPIPWGSVRLAPGTAEIQVRTPTPFLHGRLVDGRVERHEWVPGAWEPTADVGTLDADGFLSVRGRLRDFLPLPSGEKVFVTPVEDALRLACGAGLCQLVVRPDGRLGALLFFEPGTGPADVADRVRAVNRGLHPWERARSYAVVDRLPTVDEGCLTETTKPRRHVIERVHGAAADWRSIGTGT